MSIYASCDYCGEEIDDDDRVTLEVRTPFASKVKPGWVGHYHDEGCWQRVRAAIALVEEYSGSLESIPVATGQSIAARRRKHRREEAN